MKKKEARGKIKKQTSKAREKPRGTQRSYISVHGKIMRFLSDQKEEGVRERRQT